MMKGKKLLTVFLPALITTTLLLGGCVNNQTKKSISQKDTLVVGNSMETKSLDPQNANDGSSTRAGMAIYDRLVERTETMELVPGLAENWESKDPTTWIFNLRKGVKFHNGEELKASDVKFTIEREKRSSKVGFLVSAIDSIETDGDYRVIIKTKEPFAPLLSNLAHNGSSILNEKAVLAAGEDYGQKPVGTGPFKLVEWVAGDKMVFERFDNYFGEKAGVKNLVFKTIPEASSRTIALETGEIDISVDIEPVDKEKIASSPKLKMEETPTLGYAMIWINTNKKPFDNKLVRQAMNYAVDKNAIVNSVLYGVGSRAYTPLAPLLFSHSKDIKGYEYNLQKAKELLTQAGYPNGFQAKLWVTSANSQIGEVVQAQLKEIGINVVIESLESGAALERTGKGEHDMYIGSWTTVTADPDYALYPTYHSSQKGSAGNRAFYGNLEVDKLLDLGRKTVDETARLKYYQEAQKLIVEDAPDIQLYYPGRIVGMQSNIQGFITHPGSYHRFNKVTFK